MAKSFIGWEVFYYIRRNKNRSVNHIFQQLKKLIKLTLNLNPFKKSTISVYTLVPMQAVTINSTSALHFYDYGSQGDRKQVHFTFSAEFYFNKPHEDQSCTLVVP